MADIHPRRKKKGDDMTRNMTQKNKALKTQGFTHRG